MCSCGKAIVPIHGLNRAPPGVVPANTSLVSQLCRAGMHLIQSPLAPPCDCVILWPMELRHLRSFVAVADKLSFTKAAQKLRIAQPALSRQVRQLEEELGVKLLERSRRAVALTGAGSAFLCEARALLQQSEQAVRMAQTAGQPGR